MHEVEETCIYSRAAAYTYKGEACNMDKHLPVI